ncbi:MAG: hypothetical protein WC455_05180 [Dehalococcoidia bacterium]|jgi:hypothetical protein
MRLIKSWKTRVTTILIIAVVVTVYWFTMWNTTSNKEYSEVVDILTTEVMEYKAHHEDNLPVSGLNTSLEDPAGTYFIIDICALMNYVPDGFAAVDGDSNDNCDAGGCQCDTNASYIWLLDSYGKVFSRCVGDKCSFNESDGYQGVWP